MPIARKQTVDTGSGNKPIYRTSFVRHSHEILKMGYDLLDSPTYSGHEEEDITGELVRSMRVALQSRKAPKWAKNFWAFEETRVNDPTRLGKRRLRIDIEILKSQEGPRPLFRFEAKRLRDTASRREYLGKEGLGCFLDGRYAKEDDTAGMLGYVQADTISSHAKKLDSAMAKKPKKLCPGSEL
ncbi:MAG: hypothetical protein K8R36_12505 [Planctomycetales bacterium]|nr:hypothetical protein [Planctomycetales bacterium]